MALASLTVDLTLGLAAFESASSKASQILVRDQDRMTGAAGKLQRAIEKQAQALGRSAVEFKLIDAAAAGLGDTTLAMVQRLGQGSTAFSALGAQGVGVFTSIKDAAGVAATESNARIQTIVEKIREANRQAETLKTQARTDNAAGVEPTIQVLGPKDTPTTFKGRWDDRYNFDGFASELARMYRAMRRVESLNGTQVSHSGIHNGIQNGSSSNLPENNRSFDFPVDSSPPQLAANVSARNTNISARNPAARPARHPYQPFACPAT